jgi:hypothetical protein
MQLLLLALAVQANVPVILWGLPGQAKSSLIEAIAKFLAWEIRIITGSNMDPTDIGGWPFDGGADVGVVRRPPSWAMAFSDKVLGNRRAILLFEELNLAPKAVQAAMMRTIHDREVGDVKLAPGVARVAAANPPEHSAGGWYFDAPLANRFFHIDWELQLQYWSEAMIAGFPQPRVPILPEKWEEHIPGARALVASYIMRNASAYNEIPKDESKASHAFPTPRSWTMAATMLATADSLGMEQDVKLRLVQGCVGSGAAIGFINFMKDMNLPKPEDMLANPKKVKWPKRGDEMYAALTSLVAYVINLNTPKSWEKAWDVLEVASASHKDIAAACGRALANRIPKGAEPPESADAFYDAFQMAGMIAKGQVVK